MFVCSLVPSPFFKFSRLRSRKTSFNIEVYNVPPAAPQTELIPFSSAPLFPFTRKPTHLRTLAVWSALGSLHRLFPSPKTVFPFSVVTSHRFCLRSFSPSITFAPVPVWRPLNPQCWRFPWPSFTHPFFPLSSRDSFYSFSLSLAIPGDFFLVFSFLVAFLPPPF